MKRFTQFDAHLLRRICVMIGEIAKYKTFNTLYLESAYYHQVEIHLKN